MLLTFAAASLPRIQYSPLRFGLCSHYFDLCRLILRTVYIISSNDASDLSSRENRPSECRNDPNRTSRPQSCKVDVVK